MNFHNPYHFVPVRRVAQRQDLERSRLRPGGDPGAVRHDVYLPGTHSGRIVCRLETESPVVVGHRRDDSTAPARVEPFRLDGKAAIPASSLRGMISSVAEAVSDSAMRVLEKRRFSFRMQRKESLSAIGMVVKRDNGLHLKPLTLPTTRAKEGFAADPSGINWKPLFPKIANLKVYIGDYDTITDETRFELRTPRVLPPGPAGRFERTHYMRLPGACTRELKDDGRLAVDEGCYPGSGWVFGQKNMDGRLPLTREEFEQLTDKSDYVQGIVRVLGVWGREIPIYQPPTGTSKRKEGKRHEVFIPLPDNLGTTEIPIPKKVQDTFEALANERTDAATNGGRKRVSVGQVLPYHPQETPRSPKDANSAEFRLKHGDLVFFRPNPAATEVEEISLSSIWRRAAPGDAHEYFARIDPELIPAGKGRMRVTAAERIFGFVDWREKDAPAEEDALALAGRVRFSHAHLAGVVRNDSIDAGGDPFLGECTLKILATPKPPCPSIYFQPQQNGRPSGKSALEPGVSIPQGRKFYLHHRRQEIMARCWETNAAGTRMEMKSSVRPLEKGAVFFFHIDFDNLTNEGLDLLLYSLRPTDAFRHKLGMGKSIGLGSIRIDVAGVFLVHRQQRYTADGIFSGRRYHEAFVDERWLDHESARQRYEHELRDVPGATPLDIALLRATVRADRGAQHALELIGDPRAVTDPVRTPLLASQRNPEAETFKWFVAYGDRRCLRPIRSEDTSLPTLDD